MNMKLLYLLPLLLLNLSVFSQDFQPNYDESKIPPYTLPSLLMYNNGTPITRSGEWALKRRPELLNLFESQVYGKVPSGTVNIETKLLKENLTLGGKAKMKQVRLTFSNEKGKNSMDILFILPNTDGKKAIFTGLNFYGNHTIINDPNVLITTSWVDNNDNMKVTDHKATEASRGLRENRWPVEMIIDRGYGVATIYYGDIDPDMNDLSDGIHKLFYENGQTQPKPDEWGSIAAWAWGLSRVMDYFETDADIDARKVAVMGHSRLGKTSLWAGASDPRFAIVISNDSGCGGSALSMRKIGETVGRINTVFPHWFCDNFNQYNDNESALPVDQHMLIALVAPRPVYVCSAKEDFWADPKGEFLGAYLAGDVYKLYGLESLPTDTMPAVDQPIQKTVGYHIRTGGHDVMDFDWKAWMDFADMHFGR